MWKVYPAGLTRRTRRTTKVHEGETADCGRTQRLTEGNRGTQRRAACCRRQDCQCVLGITKDTKDTKQAARGPGGAWRASHAMLWGRALTRPRPSTARSGDSGDSGAPLWGDGRGRCAKRRQPPSYMSYWSYRSYRGVQDCQCGENADCGRTQRLTEGNRGTQRRAACCRRQDCQCVLGITKDTKDTKQAARGPGGAWRASHAMLWFLGRFCGGSRRLSSTIPSANRQVSY